MPPLYHFIYRKETIVYFLTYDDQEHKINNFLNNTFNSIVSEDSILKEVIRPYVRKGEDYF